MSKPPTDPNVNVGTAFKTRSPITKLHDELLWTIFLLNADMLHDRPIKSRGGKKDTRHRALTISRRSSQVCKQWREIILGSPSLWAGIIDLSLFEQGTDKWLGEVLGRTGESCLHIKGDGVPLDKVPSFMSLIDIHWKRIRVLDVVISRFDFRHTNQIWKIYGRPAKHLQSFRFLFLRGNYVVTTHHRPALFSNDAPHLTEFHWSNFDFNFQSPWLSQLRTLEIAVNAITYKITQLLALFTQMAFLEDLTLSRCIHPSLAFEPPITRSILLKLISLRLTDCLRDCVAFLEGVTLSSECSLYLTIDRDQCLGEDLTAAYTTIRHYSENHFRTHPAESLYFEVSLHRLEFFDCTTASGPVTPTFHLTVTSGGSPLTNVELSHIVSVFGSQQLANVSFFHFFMSPTNLTPSDPISARFLSGLKSLLVLITTEETLQFLSGAQDMLPLAVFPNLEALAYRDMPEIYSDGEINSTSNPLLSFLRWRREAGVPIREVNFCLCRNAYSRNMCFLEEMTGLLVGWKDRHEPLQRHYICGTGRPETLMLSYSGTLEDDEAV